LGFTLLGLQCSRGERRPKPTEDLSHGSGWRGLDSEESNPAEPASEE
jgi:hypothetical protein